MEKKKPLIFAVRLILCAVTFFAGPVLYFYLVKKGAGDAMMYSAGSVVFVVLISLIGAFAVYLILKRPADEPEACEDCSFEEDAEREETEAFVAHDGDESLEARELYPELFRERDVEEAQAAPAYYEALTKALGSQKAELVPESEDTQESAEETEDILAVEKKDPEKLPDIYDSIPDTLPEGYTVWEEDEEPDEQEEQEETEEKPAPRRSKIFSRALAVVLIAALSASFGFVSGADCTVYSDGGFEVKSLFAKESYSWQDCEKVEIAPSFFGDRIAVTLYMKDGTEHALLPSDLVFSDGFYEKYSTVYSYAIHAVEAMTECGAEKTVKERKTIESEFLRRTDIGEYISELIK
ncbi:MAG: hypothetical protein E7647_06015 [Ruminococcaceae bacterium]|nr:hypothetical protein [Oscillospiraceae bacterium]